jgi:LPXTG-site transpeptidase (sortase) family protein
MLKQSSFTFYSEVLLLLAGTIFLGTAGWRFTSFAAFQNHYGCLLNFISHTCAENVEVTARLSVPRVGLSVLVVNGDDEASLNLGAGQVPGTAPIGSAGNTVIAGHRDTAFRALRGVKVGDEIRLESDRSYAYRVNQIRIVDPEEVSVLQDGGSTNLTLITCYPFTFVGDAPKRYIVQAEMLKH